jgi:prolipoprotein diacylglyceryltransferase
MLARAGALIFGSVMMGESGWRIGNSLNREFWGISDSAGDWATDEQ